MRIIAFVVPIFWKTEHAFLTGVMAWDNEVLFQPKACHAQAIGSFFIGKRTRVLENLAAHHRSLFEFSEEIQRSGIFALKQEDPTRKEPHIVLNSSGHHQSGKAQLNLWRWEALYC